MPKWSLTKWIIAINCLIAFWSLILGPQDAGNWIKSELPLTLTGLQAGQWWRLFTTSWVHDDLLGYHTLHLFLNMLSLAALGQVVESSLGRKHFLLVYLPAGLMAVLFYLAEMGFRISFLEQTDYLQSTLIGASGCVTGLVAAFAVMHPERWILILPWPFRVRALRAVLFLLFLSLVLIFNPSTSFIAHSAHIGGAVWGFLYMGLIGWYRKPGTIVPHPIFMNPEDLSPESTMLQSLKEEDLRNELPYVLKKLTLRGPDSLNRIERAFLLKAREKELVHEKQAVQGYSQI